MLRLILVDAKIRIFAFFAHARICLFEIRFLSKCDASHLRKAKSAYKWQVFSLRPSNFSGLMTAGMVGFSTTGFSLCRSQLESVDVSLQSSVRVVSVRVVSPVDVSLPSSVRVVLVQVVSFCLLYCIILSNRRLMMTEHVDESALFTPSVTSKKKSTLPSLGDIDGDGDILKKMKPRNKHSLPPELSCLTIGIGINLCWLSRSTRPQEVPQWGKSFWLHNQ
jgi:hypothetical protein